MLLPSPLAVLDPPVLRLTLSDGRPVALRPVVPSDRDRLAEGFDALSAASRRFRFLGSVNELTETHLRYFTEVDGVDHVAWGALDLTHPEAPGFGVGRFVRLHASPDVAEFSLTVLDTAQGLGVGKLLLAVLAVEAPRVGVACLRGVIARDNARMLGWMRRLGAETVESGEDVVMDIAVPVSPEASSTARGFVETTEAVAAGMRSAGYPVAG